MSEPTSALSIEDLILRVAREIGVAYYGADGQEKAMVPIDPHDIDLCRKIVNDGIMTFIRSAPDNGWRWMRRIMNVTMSTGAVAGTVDSADATTLVDATLTTAYPDDDDLNGQWIYDTDGTGEGSYAQITDYEGATGTITVSAWLDVRGNAGGTIPVADDTYALTSVETIEGDTTRYPLPENFGGSADGPITYVKDTNNAADIEWVDESFIRNRQSVTVTIGYPLNAALRPYEPYASGAGPSRRFEIIFDPRPSVSDTVEFPFSLYHDKVRLETGGSSAGDSTSLTDSSVAALYPDDYFNGWTMKIISGTGKNSFAVVTDYTGSSGKFDVADWLAVDGTAGGTDPSDDSVYVMQPANNYHPAGQRFDDSIKAVCLAEAEKTVDDLAGRGFVKEWKTNGLGDAIKIDNRAAPRTLGSMNKTGRGRWPFRERSFAVRTYN
jgi:hypothetical protein